MRVFVAIELPERLRRSIDERSRRARRGLPPARWVAVSNLHLTLEFLGEVEEDRIETVAAAGIAAAEPFPPLALALGTPGTFPPNHPARVAWIGIDGPPELIEVQRAIAVATTAAAGTRPEGRAFHPHVTVARCRKPWPTGASSHFADELMGLRGATFETAGATLLASELYPDGARYRPLARLPFARDSV